MSINLSNVSVQQLKRAVVLREQIEALTAELTSILGEKTASVSIESPDSPKKSRRKMSAAARAAIGAAQKARWAKQKKSAPAVEAAVKTKGRRKMSAAARAKISAAATARWAKAKAANKKTLAN